VGGRDVAFQCCQLLNNFPILSVQHIANSPENKRLSIFLWHFGNTEWEGEREISSVANGEKFWPHGKKRRRKQLCITDMMLFYITNLLKKTINLASTVLVNCVDRIFSQTPEFLVYLALNISLSWQHWQKGYMLLWYIACIHCNPFLTQLVLNLILASDWC
jgi:hypothetical protein